MEEEIEALRAGDLGAYERLVSAFENALFGYAFRLTKNQEDAEDITQETFIKLYRFRANLKLGLGLKNFLFKIATNLVRDLYRKKKRDPILFTFEDEDLDRIESETKGNLAAYNLMEEREAVLDIERALVEIKPEYRLVLLLFYHQSMTYEEIAVLLEIPLNTVKTYIHRGRAALKVKLLDYAK